MTFVPVAIYDYNSGAFLGYGIKDDRAVKLQSANLWKDGEEQSLNDQLRRLNNQVDINKHWPHPQDPDVQKLLNDPNFFPIEYEEAEVVDDEKSNYVWKMESETDEHGNETGRMVQGSELDEEASTIVTKMGKVPKRPTDIVVRIKKASEQVARQRAGLL